MEKRYNAFSDYLKQKFGAKVYKITLDAGFSCPNRDGTISNCGCIFCDTMANLCFWCMGYGNVQRRPVEWWLLRMWRTMATLWRVGK